MEKVRFLLKTPSILWNFLKNCLFRLVRLIRKIFRLVNRILLLSVWIGIISVIVMGGSYVYYVYFDLYFNPENAPDVEPFIRFEPPATGLILDKNGQVVIELAKESEYRKIINYNDIPPILREAILSAEDERFFSRYHYGIDYKSIARAMGVNIGCSLINSLTAKKLIICRSQGASTLTQQSVRLWFLPKMTKMEKSDFLISKSFWARYSAKIVGIKTVNSFTRKLREAQYSVYVTSVMKNRYGSLEEGKKQIFTRFANYTYFGNGRYGVEEACEYYFDISCKDLTEEDADKAALIAGMIKSPSLFAPRQNQSEKIRKKQLERKNAILALMKDNLYIKPENLESSVNKPIEVTFHQNQTIAPSVVSDILKEAKTKGFSSDDVFAGYVQVNSTVDLRIQEIANSALENGLLEYEKRHPEGKGNVQGSIVVLMNNDGAILAEVGGRKEFKGRYYKYSDLNRVNRLRQEGSSFKPFVYLTAYMNGWKPTDLINDSPFSVSMGYGRGRHPIHNYDGKYVGTAPIETMLYRSRNVPTVKLALALGDGQESGMEKIAKTIKLLGIETPLHNDIDHKGRRIYYITSALGASEMTLMELTNAYRAISSGIYAKPYMVQRVTDRTGQTLFPRETSDLKTKPVEIDEEYLDLIRSSMRKVVTQPGGTAYSLTVQKFPIPVMGKTGTTDDFRNALFVGSSYGPNGITIGVRINYDDNGQLGKSETGALTALPIFKKIMGQIYESGLVGPIPEFLEKPQS